MKVGIGLSTPMFRVSWCLSGRTLIPACLHKINTSLVLLAVRRTGAMDAEKSVKAESKFIKQEVVAREKWLALQRITYTDPTGKERTWDAVFRTTKQGEGSDAVVIIPILKRKDKGDSLVVVKQFRPPVKGYTLEFPAGLIDKGESPELCALRELQEETGYKGTVVSSSPITYLDAGIGNTSANIVTVEVDADAPENSNATPTPDEGEFTETFVIPVAKFFEEIIKFANDGVALDSRVFSYAQALEQYKRLSSTELHPHCTQ